MRAHAVDPGPGGADGVPRSTHFSVVDVEGAQSVGTDSHGDLWPTAWADDGHVYTACGDGRGFPDAAGAWQPWSDIVVNRLAGTPWTGLRGVRLAAGDDVAPVWTDPARFNRKPTGMVAVDGNGDGRDELYLAVQDLQLPSAEGAFDEAPAAGVVRSDDYGLTWHAPAAPMFTDHTFTTVMFCDLGRSNEHAAAVADPTAAGRRFVYAFGLDHNWRASHSRRVPDPEHLYLARVPAGAVQDRSAWEFYAGGTVPTWSADLDRRVPVLSDTDHRPVRSATRDHGSRIAQGGVVYDAPLRRYLYTSWTESTFELFEAPQAWGPWRHAGSRDVGPRPWTGPDSPHPRHGGYATTMPSAFISSDGRDVWMQSNWFVGAATFTGRTYHYSLRRVRLEVADAVPAPQPPVSQNLAHPVTGARAVATALRCNRPEVLNDGRTDVAEDSWNGAPGGEDHWGYTWPSPLRMSRVVYVSGPYDTSGGWFAAPPAVQVRRDGVWADVPTHVSPPYSPGPEATGQRRFTLDFDEVTTDGVRVVGVPGGGERYTAVSELEVYCRG